MKQEKKVVMGAPEWVVTYGDMMSLLLCFFVILVSMSEIKKDQKFQDAVDSIRAAFGYEGTIGVVPTQALTKNSLVEQLKKIVLPDYIKKEGDADQEGIDGRVFRVTNVRDGINLEIGGRISFERFQAVLRPEAEDLIRKLSAKIVGHNTVVLVRGHATLEPLPTDSPYSDAMGLSIARARTVAAMLEQEGIRPQRIRIVGAGSTEPLVAQAYTEERRALNRRVEIIVTEALVEDYAGRPIQNEESVEDDAS